MVNSRTKFRMSGETDEAARFFHGAVNGAETPVRKADRGRSRNADGERRGPVHAGMASVGSGIRQSGSGVQRLPARDPADAGRGRKGTKVDAGRRNPVTCCNVGRTRQPNIAYTELSDRSTVVLIAGGQKCFVDQQDYEAVSVFRWRASLVGATCQPLGGPACACHICTRSCVHMHHIVGGFKATSHFDNNKMNNRRSNLVTIPHEQIAFSVRKTSLPRSSKYKGVSWKKADRKWRAQIGYRKTIIHLGLFFSEESAARAYDHAAKEHFGEFARLNFPQEQTS